MENDTPNQNEFRMKYILKDEDGRYAQLICTDSDIETGRASELLNQKKELGFEVVERRKFIGKKNRMLVFEGDIMLAVTYSDVGLRTHFIRINERLFNTNNWGSSGGNGWCDLLNLSPIYDYEDEVEIISEIEYLIRNRDGFKFICSNCRKESNYYTKTKFIECNHCRSVFRKNSAGGYNEIWATDIPTDKI